MKNEAHDCMWNELNDEGVERRTNVRIKETIVLSICCWLFRLPIFIYRFEVVISSFRFISFHSMFDVIFSLFSSNIDDNVAIFHWTNTHLREESIGKYMTDKSQWMCYLSDVFKSNAVKLSHTTTVCFLSCFNRSFVKHNIFLWPSLSVVPFSLSTDWAFANGIFHISMECLDEPY